MIFIFIFKIFNITKLPFTDLVSSDAEDTDNPLNLELEDVPYQRFWFPSDQIESTDRDTKVKNLQSVLRRRFHQLSSLPDNSPSPDLVLAMTDAVRHDSICITKIVCPEPSSKTKFKRYYKMIKCCGLIYYIPLNFLYKNFKNL